MTAFPIWSEGDESAPQDYPNQEQVNEVWAALSESGQPKFASELREARSELEQLDVIEAWRRSLVFVRRPGFLDRLTHAEQAAYSSAAMSVGDVMKKLGLTDT